MSNATSILQKRWPALAAIIVLLAVAVTAGTLFAANAPPTDPLPVAKSEPPSVAETDPGLSPEYLALVARDDDAAAEAEPASDGVNQVAPEQPDVSPALARWLEEKPAVMGPFTLEQAMSDDEMTTSWVLYQAVYKGVMTQEEADAYGAWYDRRPSTGEAPELLKYQPVYLDRPGGEDKGIERGLLPETDTR